MPAALKKPTRDELYRRMRDLNYTQVAERMAVMLNAILQLEEQGECRESATEAVLMVRYTTEGISNQEQTRWLSWNVKLERDQANLERDQAVFEKDQARRELDMLKAEHRQEQMVRENAANYEQLKSEHERIQQRQRELDMQKGARPKERMVTGSRSESRMEVDEAPRSK